MIKIAIKHFIYDICIDMVFNGIQNNFIQPDVDKLLEKAWRIYHRSNEIIYESLGRGEPVKDIVMAIHQMFARDLGAYQKNPKNIRLKNTLIVSMNNLMTLYGMTDD